MSKLPRTTICFQTRKGPVVLRVRHTRAPVCSKTRAARLAHEKRVSRREFEALAALTRNDAQRTATLAGYYRLSNDRYKVFVRRRGQALRDVPGGRQKVRARWAQLERDLRRAMREMRGVGVRHRDLVRGAIRNITFDGQYFYVIDFGEITHTANYDVEADLRQTMAAVRRWVG